MTSPIAYLKEGNLIYRQGHQLYHLHRMLKKHPEAEVITVLGKTYFDLGSAPTMAAGIITAAGAVEAYRSNERGERAMQKAHESLRNIDETPAIPASA